MTIEIIQVDAFAERPFTGNPAAVCVLAEGRDASWMQSVANEMNLSETAFVVPRGDHFDLRWFTPWVEVDLCGHATLASAHVLWERELLSTGAAAHFETKSGHLTATRDGDRIELDFPATPPELVEAPDGLLPALGLAPRPVWRSRFDYVIELESETAVREMSPDFSALQRTECRGVMITSASADERYDFVSRFFAPSAGVNEDPVTGSAHCALAPFWAARLERPALVGYQASARGGIVETRLVGDRVRLGGRAITVLTAHLTDACLPVSR